MSFDTSANGAAQVELRSPQDLYELWERQSWQSQAIDLSPDCEHWHGLSEEKRTALLRALSAFFVGEERVATQFTGLVRSSVDEHEHSFLTTQQVDEVRHMQFFDRFYREVVDLEPSVLYARLDRERDHLSASFVRLFDERLVEVDGRLMDDPEDIEAKVDFVVTYHMVIEGMLGIAGQHAVAQFLERRSMFPGLLEGFDRIARDEHRHVAYGTWFLTRTVRQDDRLGDRIQEKLTELVPLAVHLLKHDIAGPHAESTAAIAVSALRRRLSFTGITPPALGA